MIGFGDVDALFNLIERYKKWRSPTRKQSNTAERFIKLFEAHGVAKAQIPRFFGHELSLYQVENEQELLKALSHSILRDAADLFGVKVEWLEGASDELYELNHFYKQPHEFGTWLDQCLPNTVNQNVDGWLLTTHVNSDRYDALILMKECIGELSKQPIYRYHFCELWIYSYWKCRADLAACIAQGWKRNCYIYGRELSPSVFEKIASLTTVPNSELENTSIRGKHFHPENLTTEPEEFVKGLSEGQFGKTAALDRWLYWHERELMDSGFGDCGSRFRSYMVGDG
ncbi:hypothetical protein [Shewanella algae]|uniref:hypothetical protein n=1 Tax=Shewanella algae TaxID=38313 RepID=UPI0011857657|nr:hypothetical protein [Shewanella algae]TVP06582.1 hypothetical protein AYI73_09870 [Shewanella algae]BCV39102.1 hypothetical protein TUM17378_03640 [Shewanella algae]